MFLPLEFADQIERLGPFAAREHVLAQEEELAFEAMRLHRDVHDERAAQEMRVPGRHDNLGRQRDRDRHRARQLFV
jgi:hypothetical protein